MIINVKFVLCLCFELGRSYFGCRFGGNDTNGGEAVRVTVTVQLCHCNGADHGQCVWNEPQVGYGQNQTFQIVSCECTETHYEG